MQLLLYECFANSSCKEVNVVLTEVEYERHAPRMTAPQRPGRAPGCRCGQSSRILPLGEGSMIDETPSSFLQTFLQGFPPVTCESQLL
jgi:hypothetical protein